MWIDSLSLFSFNITVGFTCVSACPDGLLSIDDMVSEYGISADRVRLIGGRSDLEGIVQIYHNDEWGGICGNIWDRSDAAVRVLFNSF